MAKAMKKPATSKKRVTSKRATSRMSASSRKRAPMPREVRAAVAEMRTGDAMLDDARKAVVAVGKHFRQATTR